MRRQPATGETAHADRCPAPIGAHIAPRVRPDAARRTCKAVPSHDRRPDEFPATGRVSMTPKISFLARPAVFALVLVALLWPFPAIGGPMSHVGDELLVRFRAGTPSTYHAALHAAVGAIPVRTFATVPALHLVKLPQGLSTAQAIARYRQNPDVLYAEPNHVVTLLAVPNDPHFTAGDQWSLDAPVIFQDIDIDAPEAWDLSTGSPAVVVAIIDSGIDYNHEDLA